MTEQGTIGSAEIVWTVSVAVTWTVTEQTDFSEGVVVDTAISGKMCAAHTHTQKSGDDYGKHQGQ